MFKVTASIIFVVFSYFDTDNPAYFSKPFLKKGFIKQYSTKTHTLIPLPVIQVHKNYDGFIACYSPDDTQPSIPAYNGSIHIKGYIALRGSYENLTFYPDGRHTDISEIHSAESRLCQKLIKSCENSKCWAGGETGYYKTAFDNSIK